MMWSASKEQKPEIEKYQQILPNQLNTQQADAAKWTLWENFQ